MEENKSKFVTFNCQLKLSAFAFLLPILYTIIRYFHDMEYYICEPKKSLKILKYNLAYLIYLFLPKIFSFIFILIVKSNIKGESFSSDENIVIKNYHIAAENRNKKKYLLLIYIINLLEALHEDISSIFYYYQIYEVEKEKYLYIKGWLIEEKSLIIIFVPMFAYLILHTEIHKHHILALLFGIFGCIFFNTIRFF